jgi:hypothetical protein
LTGIGDWGLGIGDWGLGPQSPIPNPLFLQNTFKIKLKIIILYYILYFLKKNNNYSVTLLSKVK